MNQKQKDKLIELAKVYNSIGAKNRRELSKQTYQKREAGEDIPYVDMFASVAPIAKQTNWAFIKSEDLLPQLKSDEGFTKLAIEETPKGLLIAVVNKFSKVPYTSLWNNLGLTDSEIDFFVREQYNTPTVKKAQPENYTAQKNSQDRLVTQQDQPKTKSYAQRKFERARQQRFALDIDKCETPGCNGKLNKKDHGTWIGYCCPKCGGGGSITKPGKKKF